MCTGNCFHPSFQPIQVQRTSRHSDKFEGEENHRAFFGVFGRVNRRRISDGNGWMLVGWFALLKSIVWVGDLLGGGFKYFLFHPCLGKISNLTNIFQMGWFNHQPVYVDFHHLTSDLISFFFPPQSPHLSANWFLLNRKGRSLILLMEEILHQLRLVVYPIIYMVLYIPGGCLGFRPPTVLFESFSMPFLNRKMWTPGSCWKKTCWGPVTWGGCKQWGVWP